MLQYKMVKVPGSRSNLEIATVETPEYDEATYTRAPEWMIKMDELLNSAVEVEDTDGKGNFYCELFGWHAETARTTTGARTSQLYTTAAIRHSNVSVIIPTGMFYPNLEQKQNKGEPIEKMKIVRLAHVRDVKKRLQEVTFETCYIQSIKQQLDRLILDIAVSTRENKIFLYDEKGNAKGQTVTGFDFITNVEKAG